MKAIGGAAPDTDGPRGRADTTMPEFSLTLPVLPGSMPPSARNAAPGGWWRMHPTAWRGWQLFLNCVCNKRLRCRLTGRRPFLLQQRPLAGDAPAVAGQVAVTRRSPDGTAPPATPGWSRTTAPPPAPPAGRRSSPPVRRSSASRRPGSSASARQTRTWNAVPRRSSGRSSASPGSSMNPTTARTVRPARHRPPPRSARGNRRRRSPSSASSGSAKPRKHTPASVAPTSSRPNGQSASGGADRLAGAAAARRARGHAEQLAGLLVDPALGAEPGAGHRIRHPLAARPAPLAAGGRARPRRSCAASGRYGRGTCAGNGTANSRTRAANASSEGIVSAPSMKAQASRTTACAMAARSPFGSQRLQARNPAASASRIVGEEAHVLAQRARRRAAGAAIHAHGGDRVAEFARLPAKDLVP